MKKKTEPKTESAKSREIQLYLTPEVTRWLQSIADERGLTGQRGAIQPIIKEKLLLQMRAEQSR